MKMSCIHIKGETDKYTLFRDIEGFITDAKGPQFVVEIKEVKNARSLQQNKFFHGPLMDAFVNATGETNRAKHKWSMKEMFLTVQTEDEWGVKNSADLDVDEMRHFIDNCIKYLTDELQGSLSAPEYDEWMKL